MIPQRFTSVLTADPDHLWVDAFSRRYQFEDKDSDGPPSLLPTRPGLRGGIAGSRMSDPPLEPAKLPLTYLAPPTPDVATKAQHRARRGSMSRSVKSRNSRSAGWWTRGGRAVDGLDCGDGDTGRRGATNRPASCSLGRPAPRCHGQGRPYPGGACPPLGDKLVPISGEPSGNRAPPGSRLGPAPGAALTPPAPGLASEALSRPSGSLPARCARTRWAAWEKAMSLATPTKLGVLIRQRSR